MRIYTLNVGQGQFVIVTGDKEAFVIDAFVPLKSGQNTEFVTAALAKVMPGKNLLGVVVTGFDSDHFCEVGLRMVINKYNADWVIYPSYKKETDTADACFKFLNDKYNNKTLHKESVLLDGVSWKALSATLSKEFSFEAYSPSKASRDSSNNSSLVLKVTEKKTSATYLITGDTEDGRWTGIVTSFAQSIRLQAKVLAAPHHGSRNGMTEAALKLVKPHTVLISAGFGNYDHPHPEALKLFKKHAKEVFQTNLGTTGQSWLTEVGQGDPKTIPWQPSDVK